MVEQLWTVGEPLLSPKRDLPATAEELGSVLAFVVLTGWSIECGVVVVGDRPDPAKDTLALMLRHACGFTSWLDQEAYLPGVINGPVAGHHRDGCGS